LFQASLKLDCQGSCKVGPADDRKTCPCYLDRQLMQKIFFLGGRIWGVQHRHVNLQVGGPLLLHEGLGDAERAGAQVRSRGPIGQSSGCRGASTRLPHPRFFDRRGLQLRGEGDGEQEQLHIDLQWSRTHGELHRQYGVVIWGPLGHASRYNIWPINLPRGGLFFLPLLYIGGC
jgi:hypothetical protein